MKTTAMRKAIRDQTDAELAELYRETVNEMVSLRVRKGGSGDDAEQPLKIRTLRRDVARMKTVMQERIRAVASSEMNVAGGSDGVE